MRLDRDTAWLDSSGEQAEVEDRQARQGFGFGFVQMSKSRWDAGLDQAHDGKPTWLLLWATVPFAYLLAILLALATQAFDQGVITTQSR